MLRQRFEEDRRKGLGNKTGAYQPVAKQLRRMPELRFYHDDTLDHVFKMEELFKKINEENKDKVKGSKCRVQVMGNGSETCNCFKGACNMHLQHRTTSIENLQITSLLNFLFRLAIF